MSCPHHIVAALPGVGQWEQNQQGLVESRADLSDPAAPAIAFQLLGFPSALEQGHVVTLELAWA